jgi:putative transposase
MPQTRDVAGREAGEGPPAILAIGISPTGGLPGMACESSRTAGRKQEEDARESGSSALQGRE